MRRDFRPSILGLESRFLTSDIRPPHQISHGLRTGTVVGASVSVDALSVAINALATATEYTGTARVNVGGVRLDATVTLTIADDQTCSLSIDDGQGDTLTATGLSLANGEAGNYTITSTTGQWATAHGSGVWYLRTDNEGNVVIGINPHQ